ncbi:alpha/beta hydrolase [Thalassotalea mangrovi]|uniref:Alpha/beta hydrolase n=1 Tax=Thalassotalea mangrovi TaxID=2572245 RepID=A0A4U1B1G5_9GAMM|nr:alpha/beta hydrolase-fold protein [Thalassotalea mangrovi]TKB43043.1 alpha/beta hydrolase [Thalassotalea mangrovi]
MLFYKELRLRLLLILSCLICNYSALAFNGFEIPRSETIELKEPATDRVYPIFVKVPRSYKTNKEKRYPVIYLTDAWYSFQITSGATRFAMNHGEMEEAIIVAISYSKGSRGASSRIRDYTPSKAPGWKLPTGNADGHARFIRDVLFPFIETNYRVSTSQRTFVGNSLGGLFGAFILFNYPEMFSSYILGSPSVWFRDNEILTETVKKSESPIKVYIAVGSLERPEYGEREDMVAGAKLLMQKISKESGQNTQVKFNMINDARHATAFPTTLIQGLDWIYGIH